MTTLTISSDSAAFTSTHTRLKPAKDCECRCGLQLPLRRQSNRRYFDQSCIDRSYYARVRAARTGKRSWAERRRLGIKKVFRKRQPPLLP